jgi:pyridoxal phosphate enzyme (YggS family)
MNRKVMSKTAVNIAKVRARIQQAARESRRDANALRLLAVSKAHQSTDIREAFVAGLRDFGENYVQEAEVKMNVLGDLPLVWHFIGPLQSNKTAFIASHFQWIHSLDRLKIAKRLSEQRPEALGPLNVCIQVNIDSESSKAGIAPEDLPAFAAKVGALPHLSLRGLMAIPDPAQGRDGLESAFARMGGLYRSLQQQLPDAPIDTLSMGMSADLELAIGAGSTLVRIGTDIFGPRA